MKLPERAFYNVWEAAARWGCSVSDIIEWATLGHLKLLACMPRVTVGGKPMGGIMELRAVEILPYFPRVGSGLERFPIYSLREERPAARGEDWMVVDEDRPVTITSLEVLIRTDAARRFEEDNDLSPTPSVSTPARHDWDGMWGFVVQYVHEQGVPETAQDLARECEAWFMRRDAKKVPDLSTISKKLRDVFRALSAERA